MKESAKKPIEVRQIVLSGISHTIDYTLKSILVVGGFSSSDYLFTEIKESLQHFGITVFRPDGYLYGTVFSSGAWQALILYFRNKVVANGAVSFYIDHYVDTRISKLTYGNPCSYIYNPDDLEHVLRSSNTYSSISGKKYVKGAFDVILTKVRIFSSIANISNDKIIAQELPSI